MSKLELRASSVGVDVLVTLLDPGAKESRRDRSSATRCDRRSARPPPGYCEESFS
jgi:hypothetical protein